MLLQSEFPPDIRVEKEATTLLHSRKFQVALIANNSGGGRAFEVYRGIKIFRLSYRKMLGKKGNRLMNYPLWFNPFWLWRSIRITARYRPQIIHVHDLPLMFLGLLLARLFNARLIYDLHENYPATFDLWKKGGIFRPVIRNKHLAVWYDKFSLKKADGVMVVEPEHVEWIRRNYGIDRPIAVISNTVDLSSYPQLPVKEDIRKKYAGKYVISYVGQISIERDLDVAIRAAAILRHDIPDLRFVIVGDGPDRARLQRLAEELNLNDQVEFVGWVPFEVTATYIRLSKVCLIPQGSNDLIDNGTPHKLYQYMALGKPVVVSDAKAMRRVVLESGCGEIFRSGDERSLADAILKIKSSHHEEYGAHGQIAVREKYNWQISARNLLELYQSLSR